MRGVGSATQPAAFGATAPGTGAMPVADAHRSQPAIPLPAEADRSQPVIAPPVALGTNDVAQHAQHAAHGKKRAMWPFLVLGLALVGGGIAAIVVATSAGGGDKPAKPDAAIAKVTPSSESKIDAAEKQVAVDASVVTPPPPVPRERVIDAPAVTDNMVKIAGGTYEIGEAKPDNAESLKHDPKAKLEEYWIDRSEVTLGAMREALKDQKAGGAPGDTDALPARRVTWRQANDACKAMGKRLPTEAEWEVAARTTPADAAKATMMRGAAKLVASTKTDCNGEGLCDMLGSVVEWTTTPLGANRVARGASYRVAPSAGWQASIRARASLPVETLDEEVGFRCAFGAGAAANTGSAEPPKPPKPPEPKPPEPKPPEPVDKCDKATLDDAREKARSALSSGSFAVALAEAEKVLACHPDTAPQMRNIAYTAACNARNAAKAKLHFAKLPTGRREAMRQICVRNGIEP